MKTFLVSLSTPERVYPLSIRVRETTPERAKGVARQIAARTYRLRRSAQIRVLSVMEQLQFVPCPADAMRSAES